MAPRKTKKRASWEAQDLIRGIRLKTERDFWLGTEPSTKNHLTDRESDQRWFEPLLHGGSASSLPAMSLTSYCPSQNNDISAFGLREKLLKKHTNLVRSTELNRLRTRKDEDRSRTGYAPKESSSETAAPAAGLISTSTAQILLKWFTYTLTLDMNIFGNK